MGFCCFENSFSDDFLELAFVEVSSNGIDFYRFNSISLTQENVQIETFGLIDARQIHNLAGKYRGMFGVPFDLSELANITDPRFIKYCFHKNNRCSWKC